MAKKYLTLEEAAEQLGLNPEQLVELREQGEIRGFADRGSWKFREQDIEEFGRTLETDSSPDIPIISAQDAMSGAVSSDADDSDVAIDFEDSFFDDEEEGDKTPPEIQIVDDEVEIVFEEDESLKLSASDSDVQLVSNEDDLDIDLNASDSDVRLAGTPNEEGQIDLSASDSDVRLAFDDSLFDSDTNLASEDSDVQLDGDSEINIPSEDLTGTSVLDFTESGDDDIDSDSDVKLVGADSDSDVVMVNDSDSDVALVGSSTDPDINLAPPPASGGSNDSSIILDAAELDLDVELASSLFDESNSDQSDTAADSDSDIRIVDDGVSSGSSQTLDGLDSDSDVKLVEAALNESDESASMLMGLDAASDLNLGDNTLDASGSSQLLQGVDSDEDVSSGSIFDDEDPDGSMKVLTGKDSAFDVALSSEAEDDLILSDSDSDVRLLDDSEGSSEVVQSDDLLAPELDSDSDVHLVDGGGAADDSDSDVLLNSDSATDGGSQDLQSTMAMELPFDSDVQLTDAAADTNATMEMDLPEDSDLKLIDSAVTGDDSGISLEIADSEILNAGPDESGISLEIDDSGISLEADDSGISLESLDSGALLTDDSGITLDADDSGISLEAADSGIALFDDDSGISLEADDMGSTQPMSAIGGAAGAGLGDSNANTMAMDIMEGGEHDSEFELAGLDDDDDDFGTDTGVLMFDDEEQGDEFSVATQPAVSSDNDLDVADFDTEDAYEDDLGDDFADDFEDEEMDDVWDAEDEDDDDGFETGESQVGGVATAGAGVAAGGWAVADQPWGALWTSFVSVATLLSVISAFVGIELVRTMWLWTQPGQPTSGLLGMLGGLFGS